jgi:hypothetical protein
MGLTGGEIYKLASETTEQEFNNLFNLFTDKEEKMFDSLVKLGDEKNVSLWTVISHRYETVKATQIQD